MAYAKAFVGALIAALSSLSVGYSDGHLTMVEGLAAVIAGLSALIVVFAVPNSPPTSTPPVAAPGTAGWGGAGSWIAGFSKQLDDLQTKVEALSK